MKNFTLNLISRVLGKHFAWAYKTNLVSANYTNNALDAYCSVRRMLPVADAAGRHLGNHYGSKKKPYLATQGV